MAQQQNAEKPRGLPNPYAPKGLPNPYARATVAESAPVHFTEEQKAEQQKKSPAFHIPHKISRPQAKSSTVAKKPFMATPRPKAPASNANAATPSYIGGVQGDVGPEATPTPQQPGLDYWRSTADDDASTLEERRHAAAAQREAKKESKKFAKQFGWWKGEAPYRPEKWSNLRAYRASGAYEHKLDSFAHFLQAQTPPERGNNSSDQSNSSRASTSSSPKPPAFESKPSFAPPARNTSTPPSPLEEQSSNDASAGRAHLSQSPHPPPPPPPPEAPSDVPPPPPAPAPYNPTISAPPVRYNPTISAPPVRYESATISAPPVRYEASDAQTDDVELEERPAKRPKLSKAEAMMAKMGYVKGKGLGRHNDGITTHLEVKARKGGRKVADFDDKDNETGKSIKAQQVFDILGGHTTKQKEPNRFGDESKVVVAWGCVDDIDWAADADRDDGGIRQEMGQVFDNKFGRVERIHINASGDEQPVYIKFASELSALNAVNRFHEGYQFRNRTIRALYYPEAKFEASIFDH
ncbi:hypothetical protein CC80DRAFT_405002 [Byssothecium circinans]|uniref:G-patch domain-containing protein n=1 Tax=Byssothecium circinans TaxID=147558 RepID=A0A6A5U5V4_9PLEO|nr:hypothetical protein CC80DRAFT_405002 [Byssothecium circinans]